MNVRANYIRRAQKGAGPGPPASDHLNALEHSKTLPVFVDSHSGGDFPADALTRALEAAERGSLDSDHARPLDSDHARPLDFLVMPGGRVICIVLASNEESVAHLHSELGLPLATVTAIDDAEGLSPVSDGDRERILRAICNP